MSSSAVPINPRTAESQAGVTPIAEVYLKIYLSTQDKQHEYGKWVLASLLAVHAGSILAISQAGEAASRLFKASGPWLIYGIGITLVAGGLAWINYTFGALAYRDYYFAYRNNNSSDEPEIPIMKFVINFTLLSTPLVAVVSLVFFFIAAWRALQIF